MKLSSGVLKSVRLYSLLGIFLAVAFLATFLPTIAPPALAEGDNPLTKEQAENDQKGDQSQPDVGLLWDK